jgi:predicted HTH domain antitoxin
MSINVTFPEELLIAAREEKSAFSRKVVIYTLGHLYQEGKISGGLVAKILDCDQQTAYTILSEYGFSVIDYDQDEWKLEVQTSKEIANQIQNK